MQDAETDIVGLIGPYSHFRVGSSVLLNNGDVVKGANVENAAYPVGICAERVALGTAVVQVCTRTLVRRLRRQLHFFGLKDFADIVWQGAKNGDIRAIAVATDISPPASPCGMCRQFIREFCEVGCRRMNDGHRVTAYGY